LEGKTVGRKDGWEKRRLGEKTVGRKDGPARSHRVPVLHGGILPTRVSTNEREKQLATQALSWSAQRYDLSTGRGDSLLAYEPAPLHTGERS
jgi:hypothetical protein